MQLSLETGVLERVNAEVEKNSAIAKKQLEELAKDKTELEEKLKEAQKLGHEEVSVAFVNLFFYFFILFIFN